MSHVPDVTAVDLAEKLGPISMSRIGLSPTPGNATVSDVARLQRVSGRRYELVDGMLVEKTVGFYEAYLAGRLFALLHGWVVPRGLGIVVPSDGMIRLGEQLVRIPDVAYFPIAALPGEKVPLDPIPSIVPALAVEIISRGNTEREMRRKLEDYFSYGCQLVWYVYPADRIVLVYQIPEAVERFRDSDVLTGGSVLPGLEIPVSEIFGSESLGSAETGTSAPAT